MKGTQVASEMLSGNAGFLFVQMQIELSNQVVISPEKTVKDLPRRTLDLSNIQTQELKLLSPLRSEIAPRGVSRARALLSYSERLRNSYKSNEDNLREGMMLLADTLRNGQTVAVSCFCRAGEICHADVVKMAIEKVHERLQIRETSERQPVNSTPVLEIDRPNPRTQRTINEILSVSNSDLLLAKLDNTEGRSQSEHASYLNQHSQFTRDLYERGAMVRDGVVIVPKEHLSITPKLNITTSEHAVNKLEEILQDRAKAKDLAPTLVEHGKQIAGADADRETQIKVFDWIYRSLEGKTQFLETGDNTGTQELASERFDRTMNEIANLAKEMGQLEPSDHFISFEDHSKENGHILPTEEKDHENSNRTVETSSAKHAEFERIELGNIKLAQMASEMHRDELERWFQVRLPALDRDIESGKQTNEILDAYRDNIYTASIHDPYQKQAAIDDLKFASAYVQHQLKQPDSRLRHFNARYRRFAAILEGASTRNGVMAASSQIRSDNARIGLAWENISANEKARVPPPLSAKEIQLLFSEASPKHYTAEMTAARLSYALNGTSRNLTTRALIRGEILPSFEAQQLLKSLESRLERRDTNQAIAATKHFLISLKTPDEDLRYPNPFDHNGSYRVLPSQEKDFIYTKAVEQRENLESHLHQIGLTSLKEPLLQNKFAEFKNGVISDLVEAIASEAGKKKPLDQGQTNNILKHRLQHLGLADSSIDRQITQLSSELAARLGGSIRSASTTIDRVTIQKFGSDSIHIATQHPVVEKGVGQSR